MADLAKTNAGSRPIPDPTELTTRQLIEKIGALRELMEAEDRAIRKDVERAQVERDGFNVKIAEAVAGLRIIIETRLGGMDKAITLLQATTDKMPLLIDEKILSLKVLHAEKFESIQTQFKERDVRDERSSRDSKTAVDAALSAAKEAVASTNASSALAIAKSESATDKRIDQQGQLIATGTKALDEKIDDLKERITRLEGKGQGIEKQQATQQSSIGSTVGVIGSVLGVLSLLAAIAIAVSSRF